MGYPGSPDNIGFQSPGTVIANSVVIEGPNDSLLMYNGLPAANNLIGSDSNHSFIDDQGNNVLGGRVVYDSLGYAHQIVANGEQIFKNAAAPAQSGAWLQVAETLLNEGASNYINEVAVQRVFGTGISVPITAEVLELIGNMALSGTINTIVGGVEEHWHTPVTTGFGTIAGAQPVEYIFEAFNTVDVTGAMVASAAYVGGTTIWTMPAAYRPTTNTASVGVIVDNGGVFSDNLCQITPAGLVTLALNVPNAAEVFFVGGHYRLAA